MVVSFFPAHFFLQISTTRMSETEAKKDVSFLRHSFSRSKIFTNKRRAELKAIIEKKLSIEKGEDCELCFGTEQFTKSDVWFFWLIPKRKKIEDRNIYCLFCGNKALSGNGTTSQLRHTSNCSQLKLELEQLPDLQHEIEKKQQDVQKMFLPNPLEKARLLLVDVIFDAKLPYSIVQRPKMRKLFQYLATSTGPSAKATPPSREDVPIIGRKFVEFFWNHIHSSVLKQTESSSIFSWTLVIDCWSDQTRKQYFGIILRYIDDKFSPVEHIIGLKATEEHSHTAVNIGKWISECLKRLQFDRLSAVELTYRFFFFFFTT